MGFGEGGIRTLSTPLESVTYRFYIADDAGTASVAVGPCSFLPDVVFHCRRATAIGRVGTLIEIADQAGGSWPDRTRRAALTLMRDIRTIFDDGDVRFLASTELVTKLYASEDRPSVTWTKGKAPNRPSSRAPTETVQNRAQTLDRHENRRPSRVRAV
jgi:hypothetical protein